MPLTLLQLSRLRSFTKSLPRANAADEKPTSSCATRRWRELPRLAKAAGAPCAASTSGTNTASWGRGYIVPSPQPPFRACRGRLACESRYAC